MFPTRLLADPTFGISKGAQIDALCYRGDRYLETDRLSLGSDNRF